MTWDTEEERGYVPVFPRGWCVPGASGVPGDRGVMLCEVSVSPWCRRRLSTCASRLWSHPVRVCCPMCRWVVCLSGRCTSMGKAGCRSGGDRLQYVEVRVLAGASPGPASSGLAAHTRGCCVVRLRTALCGRAVCVWWCCRPISCVRGSYLLSHVTRGVCQRRCGAVWAACLVSVCVCVSLCVLPLLVMRGGACGAQGPV